jgi:hypothetical protein
MTIQRYFHFGKDLHLLSPEQLKAIYRTDTGLRFYSLFPPCEKSYCGNQTLDLSSQGHGLQEGREDTLRQFITEEDDVNSLKPDFVNSSRGLGFKARAQLPQGLHLHATYHKSHLY